MTDSSVTESQKKVDAATTELKHKNTVYNEFSRTMQHEPDHRNTQSLVADNQFKLDLSYLEQQVA